MTRLGPAHFIVGSGRCGSTLLSSLLAEHRDVLSLSEVFSCLGESVFGQLDTYVDGPTFGALLTSCSADLLELARYAPPPELLWRPTASAARTCSSPLLLIALPLLSAAPERLLQELLAELGTEARAPLHRHFNRAFGWLVQRFERSLWIERSGGSLAWLESLVHAWPAARLVHIARDGRASALSMSRHAYFRVLVARLVTRTPSLSVQECLKLSVPLHRYGAYWSALMVRSAPLLKRLGERVHLLRYEQLLATPASELSRLEQFLGVTPNAAWRERSATRIEPGGNALIGVPLAERRELERACLPGLRILDGLNA